MHIPKTGGSSVARAMRRRYRFSHAHSHGPVARAAARMRLGPQAPITDVQELAQLFSVGEVLIAALRGKKFITGHVWFDQTFVDLRRDYQFQLMSLLRDPVERWVSQYFYQRYTPRSSVRITADFEKFCQTPEAAHMGATYVQYFLGRPSRQPPDASELEEAAANAAEFDLIGFMSDIDAFVRSVEYRTNTRMRLGHRRKSPAPSSVRDALLQSTDARRIIDDLCTPDHHLCQLLYERRLFTS